MTRTVYTLAVAAILVSMSTGCRNGRLLNPCANQCVNPCGIAANPTLPSPPTGSLQIPALGQNQPYYNRVPTTARQPNYLINPNSPAPTPATNTPSLAPQNGWRPVGSNSFSLNSNGQAPTTEQPTMDQPRSVLQQPTNDIQPRTPTRFASNGPVFNSGQPLTQTRPVTGQSNSRGNGLSFKDSVNYQSTRIDERQDQTRLAATDATAVRAPTTFSAVPQIRTAQAQPVYGAFIPGTQTTYNQPVYPAYTQTQFVQTQPVIVPGTIEYGQPMPPYATSGPTVLAQSTTTYNPQTNPDYDSSGWRDRDLTTRR